MQYMKFRVFPIGLVFMVIFDLVASFVLGLIIFAPSEKEIWLWIMASIMFIMFPVVFSVYILSFSLDTVVIDENGVKKYHYGKLKKNILWSEIITFKLYPNNDNQGWIYLSNYVVEYNYFTSTFMMFDKKSICIKASDKILTELNKYLNDRNYN